MIMNPSLTFLTTTCYIPLSTYILLIAAKLTASVSLTLQKKLKKESVEKRC